MRKIIPVVVISLFLLGCAKSADDASPTVYGDRATYGAQSNNHPHAGQWAVAAIGTPFYLAFKTVVCGATLVVAAPAAASDRARRQSLTA